MHRVCNLFDSHAVSFTAVLSTARYSCLPLKALHISQFMHRKL
ncbi:hypothetical protein HMPREF3214_00043 [Alloscardovia omnicolens]|nr:hypothetical protein HMPREF3214_00043 [Alloscardovia omnicolens]